MAIYFQGKKVVPYFNGKKIGTAYYHGVKVYSSVINPGSVIWKSLDPRGQAFGQSLKEIGTGKTIGVVESTITTSNVNNLVNGIIIKTITYAEQDSVDTAEVLSGSDINPETIVTKKISKKQLASPSLYQQVSGLCSNYIQWVGNTIQFSFKSNDGNGNGTRMSGNIDSYDWLMIQSITAY
ncbi:hypothetical protein [Lentilactobacillus sunkii]|uniref:Uncharacterized protein n=1 Tax=Lentilactobacillus sunkii DSM 19904 TaxID=1423808 RepID=A0A0R1KSM9_9LACO|nr:hypothetical protein [Lentilactobacillus sunkii]KRK86261.1 hypothetical protein FD17_GL002084 [Lentilactobacillus sunkii DSM 19904]